MKKMKGFWLRIGLLCMVLCLCASFAACGGQEVTETTAGGTAESQPPVTYSLEIKSQGGSALSDVTAYIYADSSLADLVAVVKTDKDGKTEFSYTASDSYVAVLSDVPQGYTVEAFYPITGESTQIILTAELVEGDLSSVSYQLGDVMQDFTFTGTDGTEYKLSELLKVKKAVVLNFWYTNCNPCKQEFPYLQEAYTEYSDVLELLAIDPIDADNTQITAFAEELGLTFPMGAGDPAWEKAMKIMGYPTTVVIDRYGTIALYHSGSIPDDQKFKDIFAFFTAEEYTQTVVEDIEELATSEDDPDAVENPVDISGQASFQLTIEPGKIHYVNVHKMKNVWLQVNNSDIYVEYGGKKFTASNGSVGLLISAPSTFEPAQVGFGNSGDETQTFTVTLSNLAGSYENPYTVQLGEFTVSESAGNDQGVYFTYTAQQDGYFSLQCLSISPNVSYDISMMNLTTSAMRNLSGEGQIDAETGNKAVTMAMNKGEALRITVGTLPDDSNNYPAATFKMLATFDAGEVEDIVKVEKIAYAVTVTDENRNPVPNININLVGSENTKASMITDENGVASAWIPKESYTGKLIVPTGYDAKTTQFELTPEMPYVSLKLDTVVPEEKLDYTVRVTDDAGTPLPNVMVVLGNSVGSTDSSGVYTVNLDKGDYSVMIVAPVGYTSSSFTYTFPENDTSLTVTLYKQSEEQGGVTGGDIGGSTGGSGGGTGSVGGNTGGNQGGASGGSTGGSGSSGGNTSGGNIGGASGGSTGGNQGTAEDAKLSYTVTVVDAAGNPQSGVSAVIKNTASETVYTATTDNSGKVTVRLTAGIYTVSLSASGKNLTYNAVDTILTNDKTATVIAVAADLSGEAVHEPQESGSSGYKYFKVYLGSTKLDLTNRDNVGVDENLNGNWMYMFYPAVSGVYTVTVSSGAEVTTYGTMVLNPGSTTKDGADSFDITIRDGQFANDNQPGILLGVEPEAGVKEVYLTISRTADAPAELPVITYEPVTAPKQFTLNESGTITYVNLTGTASITKKSDGYYLNGKKLYVNIGNSAPYITMSNMMGLVYDSATGAWNESSMGTALKGSIYEGDEIVGIEDFTMCMWDYIRACDPVSGLYPLNDDLIKMFKNGGTYMGWWNDKNPNYLFSDLTGLNTDIAWMFACCYIG